MQSMLDGGSMGSSSTTYITEIKKDSSNQMSFYINALNFYNPGRCQELGH